MFLQRLPDRPIIGLLTNYCNCGFADDLSDQTKVDQIEAAERDAAQHHGIVGECFEEGEQSWLRVFPVDGNLAQPKV